MAKKPTLSDIANIPTAAVVINANNERIEAAFDNTLSLDGSAPNAMEADLDLNSNDILNVRNLYVENIVYDGADLGEIAALAEEVADLADAAAVSAAEAEASAVAADLALSDKWRSAWLTATAYAKGDLVRESGSTYICVIAHTSGVFATDLTAVRWELFAQQGTAGAGTGDVLAANNGSDFDDIPTVRANLGLGTMAVLAAGTGGTNFRNNTENDARFQPLDSDLTTIAATGVTTSQINSSTLVTAVDTLAANDNDTTIPTSAAVKDYVDAAGGVWEFVEDVYDSAVDGTQTSVETSNFEDGYSYMFKADYLSGSGTAGLGAEFFRQTSAAYSSVTTIGGSTSGATIFEYTLTRPMETANSHTWFGHVGVGFATTPVNSQTATAPSPLVITHATAQKISKIRFARPGQNFNAGKLRMYRQKVS